MTFIPEELWTAPILQGRNLAARSLAAELGSEPALLVFVRHLG